jgi:hypothetical protein
LLSYASGHHKDFSLSSISRGAGDRALSRLFTNVESNSEQTSGTSSAVDSPIFEELAKNIMINPHSPIFDIDDKIDEDEVVGVELRRMSSFLDESGDMSPNWGENDGKGETL